MSRRPNISASLRRRRALRVALGERRFRWRAYDHTGRYPYSTVRIVRTYADAVAGCHTWLDRLDPDIVSWWFSIQEIALDSTGKYSVVVGSRDVLVYRETLWSGYRPPFVCEDRKAVCYG